MSFESITPKPQNIDGDNAIVQGTDWIRTFQVTHKVSGVDVAYNCSEYAATPPRCNFRDKPIADGGVTTGFPQPTCSWLNGGLDGLIQVHMPHAQTTPLVTGTPNKFSGTYSIEIDHTATGYINETHRGTFEIVKEITN